MNTLVGTESVRKTVTARLGNVHPKVEKVLESLITAMGVAVQFFLDAVLLDLKVEKDELGLKAAYLTLSVTGEKLQKALAYASANSEKTVQERIDAYNAKRAKKGNGPIKVTTQTLADPRWKYSSSYRLSSAHEHEKTATFTLLERYQYQVEKGGEKKWVTDYSVCDVLPGLINNWLEVNISFLPKIMREAVSKVVAEQVNSNLGLLIEGSQIPSRPSTDERDPKIRAEDWQASILALARSTKPLEYVEERVSEEKVRQVCVDPLWLGFAKSPYPKRFPVDFVKHEYTPIFSRTWQKNGETKHRLYIALPVFLGVSETSTLGEYLDDEDLFWHLRKEEEFEVMKAWAGVDFPSGKTHLMFPLEYDEDGGRFEATFADPTYRAHKVTSLCEKRRSHQERKGESGKRYSYSSREWQVHFSTEGKTETVIKPNTLGIHFHYDPVISWTLVNSQGQMLEKGQIGGNEILGYGLSEKEKLEEAQKLGRSVHGKKFDKEMNRQSVALAQTIVKLALAKNANIALENIGYVQKSGGAASENRLASMCNYSKLATLIKWYGIELPYRDKQPGILSYEASSFLALFTCPHCGTCRKGKEKEGQVKLTELSKGTFTCNKCKHTGPLDHAHAAYKVAAMGATYFTARAANKV